MPGSKTTFFLPFLSFQIFFWDGVNVSAARWLCRFFLVLSVDAPRRAVGLDTATFLVRNRTGPAFMLQNELFPPKPHGATFEPPRKRIEVETTHAARGETGVDRRGSTPPTKLRSDITPFSMKLYYFLKPKTVEKAGSGEIKTENFFLGRRAFFRNTVAIPVLSCDLGRCTKASTRA